MWFKINLSSTIKVMILIIVALIIIIIVTELMLFKSNTNYIQEEYSIVRLKYENILENLKLKNYYERREKELISDIKCLKVLSSINQEDVINILNEHLSLCDIKVENINFNEVIDNNEEINEELVTIINVKMEFKSTYNNFLLLLDSLQNNEIDFAIISASIFFSENEVVDGIIEMNFYGILMSID